MTTNFSVNIGEIGLMTFIRRPGIRKWIAISHLWFLKRFICGDLATSYKHLVNSGHEFKWVKDVHPLVNQQFDYVRLAAPPLLDLVGISTEFSGAITTQFSFIYTIQGVTAMPCGLHAMVCHAQLIPIWWNSRTIRQVVLQSRSYFSLLHSFTLWLETH